MLSPLRVTSKQELDLALLFERGQAELERVADFLQEQDRENTILSVHELLMHIATFLGADAAAGLVRQIVSLGMLSRQRGVDTQEAVDALTRGLASNSKGSIDIEAWKTLRPSIERILCLHNIRILVKAVDLSFDYANLIDSAKLLTDVRPVFDEDEENPTIVAAIVSHVLRITYANEQGHHSVSLLLDKWDVEELLLQCRRALSKMEKAEQLVNRLELKALAVGEELYELR